MKSKATCYMCDSLETSREHAPPECFFLNSKEFGRDLKRNLITVPSCDKHNSLKSKDDEFFKAVITMASENSKVGMHQFRRKILRAVIRNPNTYETFFVKKETFNKGSNQALEIDRNRFDNCIDHLARAIFYYRFNNKWELPLLVFSPNFISSIENDHTVPHKKSEDIVAISNIYLKDELFQGENPEVFKYRIKYNKVEEIYVLNAVFNDSFNIYSISLRNK